MNSSGTSGEPSCKRQENGDASTGSERPLKKARFAWQVKGNRKYHLKNETSEAITASATSSESGKPSSSQNESISHDLVGSTEQNLEILGDYLLKQDFNTLDSVIADSDKSLLKPSTSLPTEKLEYPRYVSSYDNSSNTSSSRDDQMSLSLSMVASQSYNEDQCIARWQARQMAKGFVDNTINRVLDSWMMQPLPAEVDSRFLALDVAEFINNLPGDNSIENEGILMAISAHGLQNTSTSSSNNESHKDLSKEAFPSRSNSPINSEEESEMNNNKRENDDSDLDEMTWPKEANDSETGFSMYPDLSSSSYLSYVDNEQLPNTNNDFEGATNDYTSHFDFMDAAVSFAIQNKGLTSFGTDYG
ncbi:hypothetical protein NE865_04015 [Phthorimaea operculella]|nr:hypothetical protein NE865_04015 [Phthorimaea operculella]